MVPVEGALLITLLKMFAVGEKVGFVCWLWTTIERVGASQAQDVRRAFVHNAERTVVDEEQLFYTTTRRLRTANVSLPLKMYFFTSCSIHWYLTPSPSIHIPRGVPSHTCSGALRRTPGHLW